MKVIRAWARIVDEPGFPFDRRLFAFGEKLCI